MDAEKSCPICKGPLQNGENNYFCLSCNSSFSASMMQTKDEKRDEAKNYWLWVLGFIVFCIVIGGSVYPPGVVVVLIAAGIFYYFASKAK